MSSACGLMTGKSSVILSNELNRKFANLPNTPRVLALRSFSPLTVTNVGTAVTLRRRSFRGGIGEACREPPRSWNKGDWLAEGHGWPSCFFKNPGRISELDSRDLVGVVRWWSLMIASKDLRPNQSDSSPAPFWVFSPRIAGCG